MKIPELRKRIQGLSAKDMETIIVEMYKMMPKKFIEEKQIDELITHGKAFTEGKRSSKKVAESTDFISLKTEIEQFIEYANHQYYLVPNRIVPKKDRPKWRFIVKRFVNQLMQFAKEPQYAAESASLLESLYKLICRACSEYLFNTEDPFRSIMIDQLDFFRSVVTLKKKIEPPEKWASDSILLILDCETDRELVHTDLMNPLLEVAEEKWLKELFIKQCDLLLQAYLRERKEIQEKQGTKIKKSGWSFPSSPDVHIQRKIENLVLMVLMAHFNMDNYKIGIDYFKKYYVDHSEEVKLYVLLKWLMKYDVKEEWVSEYENAVQNGVEPRSGLKKMYTYIQREGKLPDYIFW